MKAERKYLAHYIDSAFDTTYAAPEYVRLGKDLEEFSPEMSAQVETKKNILGESSVLISGYEKTAAVEPFYAQAGSQLFERLQAIIDEGKVLEDVVEELNPFFVPELKNSDNWYIINKPTFGCVHIWNNQNFSQLVNEDGKDVEVTFCGTCTDICVISNAMIVKSLYPEVVINVKADACAGLTPDKHKAALNVMDSCQINVI